MCIIVILFGNPVQFQSAGAAGAAGGTSKNRLPSSGWCHSQVNERANDEILLFGGNKGINCHQNRLSNHFLCNNLRICLTSTNDSHSDRVILICTVSPYNFCSQLRWHLFISSTSNTIRCLFVSIWICGAYVVSLYIHV